MYELDNFDSMKISLASPEKIREWSYGEVKKPETINYRTLKPERDGLFCERIFGPTKDWECHCGRYKRVRYKGIICDKCGVEVTRAKVRRERMGHIELAAPVSHIWYFRGAPSRMRQLLDIKANDLEKVLYFASYVVIDKGDTPLENKHVFESEREYRDALEQYGDRFRAGMGAAAIKELLQQIDLEQLAKDLREEIQNSASQKRAASIKRLEVVEAFQKSGNRPEWMILDVLPVIPPDLRPMVQLDGGRFATSDLNDLYRRVINRNNRLKRLLELKAPDIIVRNEKRMLQEAVDALIDNGRRARAVTGPGNRPLKSLSELLRGKQGRFRMNLLGKRVDYSGRSVIVVGPELKMYQCGLPKEMALELFKPFVIKSLTEKGLAHNIKSAKRMVERVRTEVWDVLEEVIKDHPVLLNRAPTLHRLGIQAFEPVLIEGRAIKLHPLACTAFNADFDGDQMAVHVPLSVEAQAEARFLMLAANNILKPQDGRPVVSPTQDMVMGVFYLTAERLGAKGEGLIFSSPEEAIMAYQTNQLALQAKVKIRFTKEINGAKKSRIIETTVGRVLFNEAIPQDLGMVDRSTEDDLFKLEVDCKVGKKLLGEIVDRCFRKHGAYLTSQMLDKVKTLGYHYSTKAGITVGYMDVKVPPEKPKLIKEAEKKIQNITEKFRMGLLTEDERYNAVVRTWETTTNNVTSALERIKANDPFNPVHMMADSGARGSMQQIRQLAGMRGMMKDTAGRTIEMPIRANFREGLTVLEFFISSHGARKGLADTALRTADSGYLTRRLVDVAQDVIVREDDCFAQRGKLVKGMWVEAIKEDKASIENLKNRLEGRVAVDDVVDPNTGEVIVAANELISFEDAQRIEAAGITRVQIRTVYTCTTEHGVCRKCYGANMASGTLVDIGEAVGIVAAQSIGEPGTQLTMRTFHTGGVASAGDITQGLPRIEEIFEARNPKGAAVITEIPGIVQIRENRRQREITIVDSTDGRTETYTLPYASKLKVNEGDFVEAGDSLTEGPVNPSDILRLKGPKEVQAYMLKEVQKVYRMQGVEIADKHIEVIIRQMMRKVQVEETGDTSMLPGELVDVFRFEKENIETIEKGGQWATAKPKLLGITKAALATESFLSAASFQETTRVLTDAAIKGKVDPLVGLKENVIIGKLIPAGVGMKRYKNVKVFESGATLPDIHGDDLIGSL
ncbi:MAG: DNA-directed RNA polymerase subunit beta' [Christensenellales bacterium]